MVHTTVGCPYASTAV